ncbi:MAG TPA: DUF4330 domain-containing protein [Bacillota bacterium]|nr:DUF4330 domain-containing protein [Bacillota bacterium]HQC35903.1 DUF4330 domain-containing protein [Bacillota bacterium]
MKIINEKGKLFGIINIIDLMVLVMVLAVVAAVGVKLFGTRAAEAVTQKSDCWMEVEIYGCMPDRVEEVLRQNLIGERLVSGNSYMNATIEDVWVEDCIISGNAADGKICYNVDAIKKNILVLIKTQVSPDTASPTIGSQDMRAGKTFIVKTQTFESSGVIRYVEIGEYTGTKPAGADEGK